MEKLIHARAFKVFLWFLAILAILFLGIIIYRVFHFFRQDRVNALIETIHSAKISMKDVTGENLPPEPGPLADLNIPGIDTNENGIRDDVELGIFKAYPNETKTRSEMLQYAFALQMIATLPIMDEVTASEMAVERSRAFECLGERIPQSDPELLDKVFAMSDYVEKLQLNTPERERVMKDFYSNVRSYNESRKPEDCDVVL